MNICKLHLFIIFNNITTNTIKYNRSVALYVWKFIRYKETTNNNNNNNNNNGHKRFVSLYLQQACKNLGSQPSMHSVYKMKIPLYILVFQT